MFASEAGTLLSTQHPPLTSAGVPLTSAGQPGFESVLEQLEQQLGKFNFNKAGAKAAHKT